MANPKRVMEESNKVLLKRASYLVRLLREEAPNALIAECVAQVVYAATKIFGKKILRKVVGAVTKDENLRRARLCVTCALHESMPKMFICEACNNKDPEIVLREIQIKELMKESPKNAIVH